MTPTWQRLGDRAIRFARGSGQPAAIVRAVRRWPHVVDVVVAHDDIAVYFDREPVDEHHSSLDPSAPLGVRIDVAWIAALDGLQADAAPAQEHMLHCVYNGPDLDAVARACDLPIAEVIALHSSVFYVVETMGFLPGFGYLAGLDPRLALPRRATPRSRVPGLSVGIAGRHSAVYPFDSPGGWHLIGQVPDQPMFGPEGARLALGDRVRFVPWR